MAEDTASASSSAATARPGAKRLAIGRQAAPAPAPAGDIAAPTSIPTSGPASGPVSPAALPAPEAPAALEAPSDVATPTLSQRLRSFLGGGDPAAHGVDEPQILPASETLASSHGGAGDEDWQEEGGTPSGAGPDLTGPRVDERLSNDVGAPAVAVSAPAAPPEPVARRRAPKGLRSMGAALDAWVDGAAGYDEEVLDRAGSATDRKRRRNIGRAIVVATLVGSLGWLVKISMAMPLPWGVIVGACIAGLYGVMSYSMESFFAGNVNPYASTGAKLVSLGGRAALSAVIALSAALPWITMSLKGSIRLEMVKLEQAERLALHEGIGRANDVGAAVARSTALQAELAQWNQAADQLPPGLVEALRAADQCDAQLQAAQDDTARRVAQDNARLATVDRLEASARQAGGPADRIAAAQAERRVIARRISDANRALAERRQGCAQQRASAEAARQDHQRMAGDQRQAAQLRLAQQREVEQAALAASRRETVKADAAAQEALRENSAGEFTALLSLLSKQAHAQFLAALIFIGLFLVDVLPLTLRLFARPGPYDAEKRADDELRMMRSEGRRQHALLLHEVRQREYQSKELRDQLQRELRAHIRSLALDGVSGFMSRRSQKAS